jgi:prepilin-type N-terminal cleavage/methylation domain-containing protein
MFICRCTDFSTKRADFMINPAFDISILGKEACKTGFTLLELLTTVAIIAIISAIAILPVNFFYEKCCVMAAVSEITGMIKEAKQNALCNCRDYAIGFDPVFGKVSLLSGKGLDGTWNTADDVVVRSFTLAAKGGGLRFGYGNYGPRPDHAAAPDGITFQNNNTLVCNPNLTGSPGTVYLISRSGYAMALTMNTTDYGYSMWKWDGGKWVRM